MHDLLASSSRTLLHPSPSHSPPSFATYMKVRQIVNMMAVLRLRFICEKRFLRTSEESELRSQPHMMSMSASLSKSGCSVWAMSDRPNNIPVIYERKKRE